MARNMKKEKYKENSAEILEKVNMNRDRDKV